METREASPSHFLIKIEAFSILDKYGIKKYETRAFVAGEHKWRLIIYPNGHETGKDCGYISVNLAMADTSYLPVNWEVNAVFSIFLFNQISCIPYKRHWKISNFSILGDVWTSEKFTAGDHKWQIYMYLKGGGEETGRCIPIYLNSLDPSKRVKACYTVCIKNQFSDKHCEITSVSDIWFSASSDALGWPSFMEIDCMNDPIKGFIVSDCCLLDIEISVQAVGQGFPLSS
ncbi:hypothetical protein Pfo_026874 [Paulownia fortunei]|nr:hypothetical protein Pfo_026874 [Paulownia fortunei]